MIPSFLRVRIATLVLLPPAIGLLHADPVASTSGPVYAVPPLEYFINKLPPPPRPGSYTDRMDLGDAIARQKNVTPADLAGIQRTYLFDVFTFSDVLGPQFSAPRYPKTAAFFTKITGTANEIVAGLKNHYKRARPSAAHPDEVKLLVKNEPGFSYPSGHTTRSRLCALILSDLDPARRGVIVRAAEKVGVDRVLAGEHYQSDLAAGRKLARILYQQLSKSAEFKTDFHAVKAAEWPESEKP